MNVQIREEIDKFGIKVYQFPECDSDEDEEFKQLDKELKVSPLQRGQRFSALYSPQMRFFIAFQSLMCQNLGTQN